MIVSEGFISRLESHLLGISCASESDRVDGEKFFINPPELYSKAPLNFTYILTRAYPIKLLEKFLSKNKVISRCVHEIDHPNYYYEPYSELEISSITVKPMNFKIPKILNSHNINNWEFTIEPLNNILYFPLPWDIISEDGFEDINLIKLIIKHDKENL